MWHSMANQALWGISCNHHSHESEEDAACGTSFRDAISKPRCFEAASQISELSKFKIRKKWTGNDLVLIQFLFMQADHSSLLSLSCDLPTSVVSRLCDTVWLSWATRKAECIYPRQAQRLICSTKPDTCKFWKARHLVAFWQSVTHYTDLLVWGKSMDDILSKLFSTYSFVVYAVLQSITRLCINCFHSQLQSWVAKSAFCKDKYE